jgi:hypothetical protein
MLELVITDRLHRKIASGGELPQLISMRPLKNKETILATRMGIRRYYLTSELKNTCDRKGKRTETRTRCLYLNRSENKRMLVKVGKREPSRIYSGCSLRHIPICNNIETLTNSQLNILVALDGVNSCETVLDWLIEHNEIFKDYRITLRAHPNVPFRNILKKCINCLPDNFYESIESLQTDIKNSFCVL